MLKAYLRGIWLFVRIVLFERLALVTALLWWGFWLLAATVLTLLYGVVGMVVIVLALGLHRRVVAYVLTKKPYLVRRGDWVEYTLEDQETTMPIFERGKVLQMMERAQVAALGTYPDAWLELDDIFLLLDAGEANRIIPFEWVISLDADALVV